jgi:hypothetical protein
MKDEARFLRTDFAIWSYKIVRVLQAPVYMGKEFDDDFFLRIKKQRRASRPPFVFL